MRTKLVLLAVALLVGATLHGESLRGFASDHGAPAMVVEVILTYDRAAPAKLAVRDGQNKAVEYREGYAAKLAIRWKKTDEFTEYSLLITQYPKPNSTALMGAFFITTLSGSAPASFRYDPWDKKFLIFDPLNGKEGLMEGQFE